jgi:hypothetical protein
MFRQMIQETEEQQRLARMVGLLNSIQFMGQTACEQDVRFPFQNFTETLGVFK